MSYSKKILKSISEVCGVSVEDIASNTKRRDVTTAKRIAASILSENGFRNSEIARILNIDAKSVYNYIDTHSLFYASDFDEAYRKMYDLSNRASQEYTNFNTDLQEQVRALSLKVISLESKFEHIKALLS